MEPILKTIAKAYANRYKEVNRFCFIFPNKRCGIFLKKYFAEVGIKSHQLPHILTISEFVSQIAKKTEASKIVQLFTLFNSYKEVTRSDKEFDFEAFRGWGETVLSDFNTIDFNLADPFEIFKNVKDYREISSNFLTEEQKEVMREYFGIDIATDDSHFWKSFKDTDEITDLQNKFLNLWQVLAPVYENFHFALSENGLGSAGSIFRDAATKLEEKGKEILPYDKVIFVGFNALTESERRIFKLLQNETANSNIDDYADFIWDAIGPVLSNKDFSASKFVDSNKKYFPTPEWLLPFLEENEVVEYPDIEIISSPSVTAQSKVAGKILASYKSADKRKAIANAEVALVLPDESLLPNILYSLPDNIGDINLTMGYSLKMAPISSFMSLLRRLYATSRYTSGRLVFFMKDLKMFLSHPYSYRIFNPDNVESLLEYVSNFHKIRMDLNDISEIMPLAAIYLSFPKKDKDDKNKVFSFLRNLLAFLISKLQEDEIISDASQDISQIKIYGEYVDSLEEAINKYSIEATPLSVMHLIDKLVSSEKIGFEGEPLSGLQVMGTLETRSLDFKHVIILSMNEGLMPRRAMTSTFIPETLRKAYGLPPARYAEEIFGYYFYRLISRASKVTLIYDGRTISGLRGGQSRYLLQLRQFAPPEKIHEVAWQFQLQMPPKIDASIEKTPELLDLANAFCVCDKNRKNFSASSLNTYRECQVKFLLQYLLNLNPDPEKGEYMDAISVGDVLHNVMMQLYVPQELQKKFLKQPILITKDFLKNLIENQKYIHNLVLRNVKEIYYGDKTGEIKKIESGVTEIIVSQIVELVIEIIKYDLSLAPFNLYGCEICENIRVPLSSGRIVNFRFAIDRLDEIEYNGQKRLRIVDYKTGSRKRRAQNLEEVFKGGYASEQIFQLFTYAWLLGKLDVKGWEDVITEIYFVPDLIQGKGGLPEFDKKKIDSFRPHFEEFNKRIEDLIDSIFTHPVFKECSNPNSCEFCAFRNFCGK